MSKIALSGDASGTGTFTIASPNSNNNRTLTLPDSTGTVAITSQIPSVTIASTAEAQAGTNNTNFITPLRMREGFNASGSAPVYACRAWVRFNGTNGSIYGSGNVSSVTRVGTGDYNVNLTTAMPDGNYAPATNAGWTTVPGYANITTTSFNIRNRTLAGIDIDVTDVSAFIFR